MILENGNIRLLKSVMSAPTVRSPSRNTSLGWKAVFRTERLKPKRIQKASLAELKRFNKRGYLLY